MFKLCVYVAAFALFIGCSSSTTETSSNAKPNTKTISPNRVGDFVIGESTLNEILGDDTKDARRKFSERGLDFQFDRGVTLTGITVSSADYSLANGIAVGESADTVRSEFGEPEATEIANEKLSLPAMVYDEYTFLIADDKVTAIFVGGS
ncbi:MAG: hypothetical protein GY768_19330 [Planctomycetaceae bacterium]|nr:hypothetical protein [Planctomycetaceae bacterium]